MKHKKIKIIAIITWLLLPLATWAVKIPNPLGPDIKTPEDLLASVIRAFLGVTGSIALVMFVWGGFLWMTSAGNSDKVQKGKNVFIWSTAGLLIIFASYAILRTIFGIFQ